MSNPRVENFGPSMPAGKYRIWKAPWAYHKPWCLTTFIGTYRFKTFDGAVVYMDELASPYTPIDQPDGTCGGLLQ